MLIRNSPTSTLSFRNLWDSLREEGSIDGEVKYFLDDLVDVNLEDLALAFLERIRLSVAYTSKVLHVSRQDIYYWIECKYVDVAESSSRTVVLDWRGITQVALIDSAKRKGLKIEEAAELTRRSLSMIERRKKRYVDAQISIDITREDGFLVDATDLDNNRKTKLIDTMDFYRGLMPMIEEYLERHGAKILSARLALAEPPTPRHRRDKKKPE